MRRVVIIGGGLAGLSCAVRLAGAGRRVTVLEATKRGGGRTRSYPDSSFGRALDNGQHLMMGCYRETLAFLRTLGTTAGVRFQQNLAIQMVKPGGRRVKLSCPALPAPMHLVTGLLTMRGIGVLHKASALRAGLVLSGEVRRPDDNETCDAWLTRMGQTPAIRNAFWEPLIWAVLNDDPLVCSAAMFMAVLERAFMGTRDDSRLGVPCVPLSELYVEAASDYVRARGGELRFGEAARAITSARGRAGEVVLKSGETIAADAVVTAVPPRALLDLLPDPLADDPVFQDVRRLKTSPIVNLWCEVDRSPLGGAEMIGLVSSPLHWLFDRSVIERASPRDPVLLNCTISGARGCVEDTPAALRQLLLSELERYFPQRPVTIRRFRVIKEKRATISHAAGTYQWRPDIRSPLLGLYLAGDWVRTGLPATIESAVQSGHQVAAAILEDATR